MTLCKRYRLEKQMFSYKKHKNHSGIILCLEVVKFKYLLLFLCVMDFEVLYTADIHGNLVQYKKLVDCAIRMNVSAVIVGGDILPKNVPSEEFISGQKEFIEHILPEIFFPLKGKIPVYLMMGNDDCSANLDLLKEKGKELYELIHNKRFSLNKDFDIVGYSFVPITPFGIKDWEKFDFSNIPVDLLAAYKYRKINNYRLDGVKSTKEGWKYFSFNGGDELKDSIQKDLSSELFINSPEKTVYVIHCPPNNTTLDIIMNGDHVGSLALKRFIEERQPLLTLHGHVHETVHKSGSFKQIIKNTVSMSPGNHNEGEDLAVLVFNIYDLKNAKRLII